MPKLMRTCRVLVFTLLVLSSGQYLKAQTFQYDWANTYGSNQAYQVYAGQYICGSYNCGSYSYPYTCYTYCNYYNTYYTDVFVKSSFYNSTGQIVIGGEYNGGFNANPAGAPVNLYSYSGGYQRNIFFANYGSTGNIAWIRELTGDGNRTMTYIGKDGSGNIYVAGNYSGYVDADPSGGNAYLYSVGNEDVFIAKYDATGNYIWARTIGGSGYDHVVNAAVASDGSIYLTGNYSANFDADAGAGSVILPVPSNGMDGYLIKYSSSGLLSWAKQITGNDTETFTGLAVNSTNDVYLGGYFKGTIDIDPSAAVVNLSAVNFNGYFAKFDASGNYLWSRQLTSSTASNLTELNVDGAGNIVTAGNFSTAVDLDPLTGDGELSAGAGGWMSKYDDEGNYLWGNLFQTWNVNAIQFNSSNDIFVGGDITPTPFDADPGASTANLTGGGSDVFWGMYYEDGSYRDAVRLSGASSGESANTLAVYNDVKLFFGGTKYNTNSIDFDPGPASTSKTFYTYNHGIAAQYSIQQISAEITDQPDPSTICENQNTSFSITATGTDLSYQWQVNDGSGWNNISDDATYSGTQTASLSITSAQEALNNYQYRCVVTPQGGSAVNSDAATLTVNSLPEVTGDPANAIVCLGGNTSFTITATGTGLSYQWEVNSGGGWLPLSDDATYAGATTNTLSLANPGVSMSGYQYRCVVSGSCSPNDVSEPATLTINTSPFISAQSGDVTICDGGNTNLSVTANGTGATYQWQVNTGSGFNNISDNSVYSGSGSSQLQITGATTAMSGYQYQCIVSGICTPNAFSVPVNLVVRSLPTASIGSSQTICSGTGATINFNGTPGATVTYTINNGSPLTIALDQTGAASVSTGNLASDANYSLVSVEYTNGTACQQSASGSALITVRALPTASISGSTTLCEGSSTTIVFTGTPNTVVNYTVNGNSQNIQLDNTGTASLPTGNLNSTTTYSLVDVAYVSGPGCTQSLSDIEVVTINPIPTVADPADVVVCNTNTVSAISFSGTVAGTVFEWTNNNTAIGILANGTGTIGSFAASNNTNAPITATITVTPKYTFNSVTCTGTPQTFTITVNPTATVNTILDRVHCNGENGNGISFSGPVAGTSYAWTSTVDVGFGLSGTTDIGAYTAVNNTNSPVTTTVTVTPTANNCPGTPFTFTVTVNPTATVNTIADRIHCNSDGALGINFSGPVAGTSYAWSSTADVGFGLSGTSDISIYAAVNTTNAPIVATITVTPTANNCVGTATSFTVTVNPTATVNSINNRIHCNNESATGISFSGPVAGTSYAWSSTADIGFGVSGTTGIGSYTATNTTSAPITATITVTPSANNCTGTQRTFTVTVNPTPDAVANLATQTICSNTAVNAISFSGSVAGTVYHWTRNNTGTVTGIAASGDGTITGNLSHGLSTPQTVTFTITPEANNCFGTPITVDVVVNPLTYITTDPLPATQYVWESTSFSVAATGTPPVTYQWQVNTGSGWTNLSDNSIYSGVNNSTMNMSNLVYSMNGYQYRCVVTGACSVAESNAALLTVVKRPTTLTYSGDANEQYSDATDVKATLIDQLTNTAVTNKSISFVLGSQNTSANTNASGLASSTITLTQDPAGVYDVVSSFAGDNDYAASGDTDPFDIQQENARVDFTGIQFIATPCATCPSAAVQLRTTVQDITVPTSPADPLYDAFAGDIRNAKVKFVNRDNNSDISGWIPVTTLINPADVRTGTVDFSYNVTLNNNEEGRQITVGIIVDNGYYIRNSASDNTVITVYKPVGESITGGGHIVPTQSSGLYASDAGRKSNFGLNVKYNKNGTQPKGSVNIIFRKTVNNELRTYQVKSNAISSVGVAGNNNLKRGQFLSKANLKDITDPLNPISLGGNLELTVKMSDKGEPGNKDSIAVTLYGTDGSLWYSSNWIVTKTVELALAGGNIVVNGANVGTPGSRIDLTAPIGIPLSAKVLPNPSPAYFTLWLNGTLDQAIDVKVFDAVGRQVTAMKSEAGQSVQFGSTYPAGVYTIRLQQGMQIVTIPVVKQ